MSEHLLSELLASGIPEATAKHLIASGHYRFVTPDEAKQAVDVASPGWVVQFRDLAGDGQLSLNGPGSAPFVRFKPVPALTQRNSAEPPKYLTAKGAGCRPYFSPLLDGKARDPGSTGDIDITEGEKKADCACAHGFPTIGLSGVDCWRDKRSGESTFLPELEEINWKGRTVRIAFDSDLAHKAGVRSATRMLAFELTRRGATVLITQLPCEVPDGPGNPTPGRWKNGLDDVIVRHGAEAYRIVRNLARPCVKKGVDAEGRPSLEWIWEPESKSTREKALLAWSVFKESCVVDPARGLLQWVGTHWQALEGKPEERIAKPFLDWADAMGWSKTGLGATPQQLLAQLRQDRPWDPPTLMAFSNGTLHTPTGNFTAGHRREDCITLCLPFPFDVNAPCPRWLAFIHEALDGDHGVIQLLRAAILWTLDPKQRDQAFVLESCFDIHGRRSTGKGVLCEVIIGLLGGIGHGAARLDTDSLGKPSALFQLVGKRMAVDTDASGHIANAGVFNAIVSNEPVTVKKLYVNETTLRLGVVVWRFYNDAPTVSGGGEEGMGRRIIPFTFNRQPAQRDRGLKAALLKESSGIFAWVWSMGRPAAFTALTSATDNAIIREASIDAALRRNPKLRFLAETYPDGAEVDAGAIFDAWRQWCDNEGHKPGSKSSFGEAISKVVDTRRVGRRKVTTYAVPPMADLDWPALLGLSDGETCGAAGGRPEAACGREVDTDPDNRPHPLDAGRTPRCPPDVLPDVHPMSTQNPCPDYLLPPVDTDFLLEKKGDGDSVGEGVERGQYPPEPHRSLKALEVEAGPEETAPQGRRSAPALKTVAEMVEEVLATRRMAPGHPDARRTAIQALAGTASKAQVDRALEELRQAEADQDQLF